MADGLVNMADQFKGLPMQDLIGGPLDAAVKANVNLAQATADFINAVGFTQIWVKKNDLKTPTNAADKDGVLIPGPIRVVDFSFERPGTALDENGKPFRTIEAVKIQAPMLAIVPIPNLQVDNVDITFDMEVKSSTSEKSSEDKEGSLDATAKVGWGPFSVEVKIHGSVATHKENTRTSDNSAKYHVEVHATNHGMPEGLARILDILAQSQKPSNVLAYGIDDKGLKKGNGIALAPGEDQPKMKADGTPIP
jgi:hypothetical protein